MPPHSQGTPSGPVGRRNGSPGDVPLPATVGQGPSEGEGGPLSDTSAMGRRPQQRLRTAGPGRGYLDPERRRRASTIHSRP